MFTPARIV